jgi:hypothetical protein
VEPGALPLLHLGYAEVFTRTFQIKQVGRGRIALVQAGKCFLILIVKGGYAGQKYNVTRHVQG